MAELSTTPDPLAMLAPSPQGGAPTPSPSLEDFALLQMTPEQIEAMAEEALKREQEKQELLQNLSLSIQKKFDDRSSRRSVKEVEWIESTRLYLGSLSAGTQNRGAAAFFKDKPLNSSPEYNLVKPKVKTAIAQGLSMQFAGGDKNWDIEPSPSPDGLTPEAAVISAELMEHEILDQLNATDYGPKCRKAYEDRVVLGTGILKGPLPSRFAELTYEPTQTPEGNVIPIPVYRVKNKPVLFRVDPWMFFPDDTVNDINEAEDAIELHPFSKTQLLKLKQNPGFDSAQIDMLLAEDCREYSNQTFSEYASLTSSGVNVFRDKYSVLEYHGPITRTQLNMLEIDPTYDTTNDTYFGEVWVCQGHVLRVELEALAGTFELPYAVCPWLEDPGSIFGFGLPQEIKDAQRIANTTLSMILKNSSNSSGPSVLVNTELVEDPNGQFEVGPNKVFTTTEYNVTNLDQVFKFFEVPNVTDKLFPVLNFAREAAQEESGTPEIAAGIASPKVGSDSATGMAIMDQNSTTINDYLAEQWDDRVTEKIIRRMYHYNMQFNPKPEIIGDYEIDVRSSTEYRNKQLYIRDIEKLSVEAANNPALALIINQEALQRVRLSMMHLPSGGIIKDQATILAEKKAAEENPPPDPVMIELQLRQQEIQIKQMEAQTAQQALQIEAMKLQQEAGVQQQREMWEHEERMTANVMRGQEAQARVLEAQTLKEIELIKLAQKDEENRAKIMADLAKANVSAETQKFLGGIKAQTEFAKQQLTREEFKLRRETGEGV